MTYLFTIPYRRFKTVIAVLITCLPMLSTAKVISEHTVQVDVTTFVTAVASNGLKVPQFYVFDKNGVLLYWHESDMDEEAEEALASALSAGAPMTPPSHLESVKSVLKVHGIDVGVASDAMRVIAIKPGETIGECYPCSAFYPRLKAMLDEHASPSEWTFIALEKGLASKDPAKSEATESAD